MKISRTMFAAAILLSQALVMNAQGAEANNDPGQSQQGATATASPNATSARQSTINRIVDNAPTLAELKSAEVTTGQIQAAAPAAPKAVSIPAIRADGRDELSRIVDTAGTN